MALTLVIGDTQRDIGPLPEVLLARPLLRDVRPEISESWRRCLASGLAPGGFDVPFDSLPTDHGPLLDAAAPVLDELVRDLGDARIAFVLTNQRGCVLDRRVWVTSLAARLDEICLAEGFAYREDAVGTNGIGTALVTRRGALVTGHEHFADTLTPFTSAAFPIGDPISGQTMGAIDLTALSADAGPLMLTVARRAARDIEQRLVDTAGVADRLMLQRLLRDRKLAKGPMVLITSRTMITNAAADPLVGSDDEPLLRELAAVHPLRSALEPSMVTLSNGNSVLLWGEAVLDGSTPVATVFHLREPAAESPARRDRHDQVTLGWSSLTDLERGVTALVAQGLTNQEAAERLFVSRHTVGFHLRAIFRKLDVRSRVELARLVMQREADDHEEPMFAAGA